MTSGCSFTHQLETYFEKWLKLTDDRDTVSLEGEEEGAFQQFGKT